MYFHSVLKSQGLRALNAIQAVTGSHAQLFPVALAYVLSINLAVPVEEVDDIRAYFRMQHQIALTNLISSINELLPHNIKLSMEYAIAFYSFRYSALHPDRIPLVFSQDNAALAFFGVTKQIPCNVIESIARDPAQLTQLIGHLSVIYDDIVASQGQRDLLSSTETKAIA